MSTRSNKGIRLLLVKPLDLKRVIHKSKREVDTLQEAIGNIEIQASINTFQPTSIDTIQPVSKKLFITVLFIKVLFIWYCSHLHCSSAMDQHCSSDVDRHSSSPVDRHCSSHVDRYCSFHVDRHCSLWYCSSWYVSSDDRHHLRGDREGRSAHSSAHNYGQ